jgi:LCP family protein required for cell wall assembly
LKKIAFKCLLALIGIQVIVLCILVGNVISSIYSNKIEIVDKNEALNVGVENIETPEIDEVILPVEDDKIDESLVKDDVIYKETQKKEEVINIVLTGMDARAYETKSRSDSIILVSYNTADHTVKMVSFLRDTWVYLPERGWGRINSATAYGGTGLLINTLNENFDLDIQNYVQIKFDDFKKVIDILGGVDVELTQSEINYINNKLHTDDNDWKNDVKAKPGIVHLNGTQTLWHCRNRTIGDGSWLPMDITLYITHWTELNKQ